MTAWYLLLDDNQDRIDLIYRPFVDRYRANGLMVVPVRGPRQAIELLAHPDRESDLAGVIADFEIGGRPTHNAYKRITVDGPNGTVYPISTGIGVLDWIRKREPDVALWAVTDISARHAPLFLTAANLWHDARPLTLDRFRGSHDVTDRLFAELREPGRFEELNPTWQKVSQARPHLTSMLDEPYLGVEALDWLHALVTLPSATQGGFIAKLEETVRSISGQPNIHAAPETFAPMLGRWQDEFSLLLRAFSVQPDWPQTNGAVDLTPWSESNPLVEYLASNSECHEFLVSADVRLAFGRWRAANRVE
jgi:hypothetical protein